jgi:hypothetical protein
MYRDSGYYIRIKCKIELKILNESFPSYLFNFFDNQLLA